MEEVVVKEDAGPSCNTVLRWVGEISIEREAELGKLFAIQTKSERELQMVMSVASWFGGVDVVEVEEKKAEESLPVVPKDDGFERELREKLSRFNEGEKVTLSEFVSKYNIIRLASPTLVAVGEAGLDLLKFCGFEESESTYLKGCDLFSSTVRLISRSATDKERLQRAREVVEAARAAVNTSTVVSNEVR
jgi:hypothetical protein